MYKVGSVEAVERASRIQHAPSTIRCPPVAAQRRSTTAQVLSTLGACRVCIYGRCLDLVLVTVVTFQLRDFRS